VGLCLLATQCTRPSGELANPKKTMKWRNKMEIRVEGYQAECDYEKDGSRAIEATQWPDQGLQR